MSKKPLLLQPTSTAQWQALICEAEKVRSLELGQDLESYLVFLLMRFTDKPEMAASALALEFLHSASCTGQQLHNTLRDIGDKCLLFSGLFPGQAERRHVRISYFVELGQTSYSTLANVTQQSISQLYNALSHWFVPLMDVLHTVRDLSNNDANLPLLQATELWQDTGSQHAFELLKEKTRGLPIHKQDFAKKH